MKSRQRSNTPRDRDIEAPVTRGQGGLRVVRSGMAGLTLVAVTLLAPAGAAFAAGQSLATEIEPAVEPGPAAPAFIVADFESYTALPSELSSHGRTAPGAEDELRTPTEVSAPDFALLRPKIGPLVMEQPVRVYTNDVLVKFRAPGGRSTFATVELVF